MSAALGAIAGLPAPDAGRQGSFAFIPPPFTGPEEDKTITRPAPPPSARSQADLPTAVVEAQHVTGTLTGAGKTLPLARPRSSRAMVAGVGAALAVVVGLLVVALTRPAASPPAPASPPVASAPAEGAPPSAAPPPPTPTPATAQAIDPPAASASASRPAARPSGKPSEAPPPKRINLPPIGF
jgi:hypothetical protein